jgi:hypothetical protein
MRFGLRGGLWAVLIVAGCSSAREGGGLDATIFCQEDEQCPIGQVCRGGVCSSPLDGSTADARLDPPEIVVTPLMLDFGNALLGVDTTLTVEVANIGELDLQVTNLTVFESDGLAEFSASPSGSVSITIAGGSSELVAVTLRPEDAEIDVGELRIASNDQDEPQVVVTLISDLKGTPDLDVNPETVDYGLVSWGTTTTRDIDVVNAGSGNAPLVISAISITNDSGDGGLYSTELYDVLSDGTEVATALPVYLSAGDATTPADTLRVRVSFLAMTDTAGPAPEEDLVLMTNDPDLPEAEKHIPITGTVIGCDLPVPEVCNGLDDDCDLETDEDDPDGGASCISSEPGICAPGTEHCLDGSLQCVPNLDPITESCNNEDDDCDGTIDDGLTQPCANACGEAGVEFCFAGAWIGCTAPAVPDETCNGLDDDCDGFTDEGDPGGGVDCDTMMSGICADGTRHCVSGSLQCVRNLDPEPFETCNSLDDDCDGSTDEGDPGGGGACSTGLLGICAAGTYHCVSGAVGCVQNNMAATESCNYLDDDCNGTVDNGFDLTSDVNNCGSCGNVCSVANAVEYCSSSSCAIFSCNSGYVNTDGTYSNGCECADDATESVAGNGDTCPSTISSGTLAEGASTSISGKIATVGDEDWYQFTFTDAADAGGGVCDPFRPNISFSSNPGSAYRFQVYNVDCTTYSTCSGTSLTSFVYYSGASTDHCCYTPANPGPGLQSCSNQSVTVRIRVIRSTATASCNTYTLLVKNGP